MTAFTEAGRRRVKDARSLGERPEIGVRVHSATYKRLVRFYNPESPSAQAARVQILAPSGDLLLIADDSVEPERLHFEGDAVPL